MPSHDGVMTYASCLQISGQAAERLSGKLRGATLQVLDVGKAWVKKLFKKQYPGDQDDDDLADDDIQAPGPLDRFTSVLAVIDTAVIQEYASCIRRAQMSSQQHEVTPWTFVCTTDRDLLYGSSNILIPLCFGDGVRWLFKVPSTGHDTCWNDIASRALICEVSTMKFLRQRGLPVPEVYSFEASTDNALGCPFILMEHMRGMPVYEGWFDQTLSNEAKEQFRQRCLQTLALTMKKLSDLRFAQAGSLNYNSDGGVCSFQPIRVPDLKRISDNILEWQLGNKELDDGDYFLEIGPFDSDDGERDYLMSLLDQQPPATGKFGQGIYRLLRLFMEWMPQDTTKGSFVISHPDLDLQNILVDESGAVTGLIDWDGVATVSQLAGCTYPKWLTYDWDPWSYAYRSGQPNVVRGRVVPSPRELKRYRRLYTDFLEQLPAESGDNTSTLQYVDTVRKSLLLKSLELAIKKPNGTDNIVIKIFKLIAQISGQKAFRVDNSSNSQTDDSCESSPSGSDKLPADVGTFAEQESSSASPSNTHQSAQDDESSYTRDSTPPTEISSRSSIESNDAHVNSAMARVMGSAEVVNDQGIARDTSDLTTSREPSHTERSSKDSKGRHLRSGLRKLVKVVNRLNKSSVTSFGHEATTGPIVIVDDTRFEIVNLQHTASNIRIECDSPVGPIQQVPVENIAIPSVSPNIILGETSLAKSSEEIASSIALPTNHTSPNLESPHDHPKTGRPTAFQSTDTTGAQPKPPTHPPKYAQEIPQVLSATTKHDNNLNHDTQVRSTPPPETTSPQETTSQTQPHHLRRLPKNQTPSLNHSPPPSSSSSSTCKSRTKQRITNWLQSAVVHRKPDPKAQKTSTLPSPNTLTRESSPSISTPDRTEVISAHSTKAASSTKKRSSESDEPAVVRGAGGIQKFDLENLECIDEDRLWDEGFLPIQVCHDLVDGALDEARMRRLRIGFEVLLNSL